MAKKKPLVDGAQSELENLKNKVAQELASHSQSYRDRFRELARQRTTSSKVADDSPTPSPNRS